MDEDAKDVFIHGALGGIGASAPGDYYQLMMGVVLHRWSARRELCSIGRYGTKFNPVPFSEDDSGRVSEEIWLMGGEQIELRPASSGKNMLQCVFFCGDLSEAILNPVLYEIRRYRMCIEGEEGLEEVVVWEMVRREFSTGRRCGGDWGEEFYKNLPPVNWLGLGVSSKSCELIADADFEGKMVWDYQTNGSLRALDIRAYERVGFKAEVN